VIIGLNRLIPDFLHYPAITLLFFFIAAPICTAAVNDVSVPEGGLVSAVTYVDNKRIDTCESIPQVQYHDGIIFEMIQSEGIEYRYKLNHLDKAWTTWTYNAKKEYTNLNQGKYVFFFQYKNVNDNVTCEGSFKFSVRAPWYLSKIALVGYPIILFFFLAMLRIRTHRLFKERQRRLEEVIEERTEELRHEKEKSDRLLANMLPKGTAEEIMLKGKVAKTKYNFVTVLFSDIQGFTRIAEEMNPEALIDELDRFFFHFDSVAEKYRIEKIKTIGDAYMCAGGIPERNRTNPVEVVLAAIEMQKYMYTMKADPQNNAAKFWDIRIGIHTGTVIAGVVGHKKLTYDIWGDTVNTASRMESSGEAGKINISGTTHEFVRDYFECEYRGRMPVKYKGDLDMYFVTGIKPELCDAEGYPNKKFLSKVQMIRIIDVEEHVFTSYSENASPDLFFHNPDYIRSVSLQTELLSKAENLEDEDYINLRLASIFLYYGYVFDYSNPTEASGKRAEEILTYYGFDNSNLQAVKELIGSAFLSDQTTPGGAVLHDAVFDFLWRVDFTNLVGKLFKEEMAYGKVKNARVWFDNIRESLSIHKPITNTAKLLESVTREKQAEALEKFSLEILSKI
jgi:adenylate cyclase